MKTVQIYTDGACSGNPGAGGYGAILMCDGRTREISGFEAQTTNNRMELMAVIKALECLKKPCIVELYSDSAYTVDAFNNKWIYAWQKNNWRTSNKSDVKNRDLWEIILVLTNIHTVHFHKVKGHSDNEYNNRCDYLGRMAIKENIER